MTAVLPSSLPGMQLPPGLVMCRSLRASPRRRNTAVGSVGRTPEKVSGHDQTLNLTWAFADAADADFAIPALQGKVLRHAISTVNLHRPIDYPATRLTADEFRHGGFHAIRL